MFALPGKEVQTRVIWKDYTRKLIDKCTIVAARSAGEHGNVEYGWVGDKSGNRQQPNRATEAPLQSGKPQKR